MTTVAVKIWAVQVAEEWLRGDEVLSRPRGEVSTLGANWESLAA